jgi:hypothetical protein
MPVIHPFDESAIERGDDSIARYQNRPQSLLHMLRATVDKWGDKEALVEIGGELSGNSLLSILRNHPWPCGAARNVTLLLPFRSGCARAYGANGTSDLP